MDLDIETLQYLLQQTINLRSICIEHIYLEFKSDKGGLANIDHLAENLVELNKAIQYYKQKILELTTKETK